MREKFLTQKDLTDIGYKYDEPSDKWYLADAAADIIYLGKQNISFNLPENLKLIIDYDVWEKLDSKKLRYPLFSKNKYLKSKNFSDQLNFLELNLNDLDEELSSKIKSDDKLVLIITTDNEHGMAEQRRLFFELINQGIKNPVIIKRDYSNLTLDEIRLYSSTDFGALLIDGLGDGVWLTANNNEGESKADDKLTLC